MEAYSLLMLAASVAGAIIWDLLARRAHDRKVKREQEEAEAAETASGPPRH